MSVQKEEISVQGINSILSDGEVKKLYTLDEKEWDDLLAIKYEKIEKPEVVLRKIIEAFFLFAP